MRTVCLYYANYANANFLQMKHSGVLGGGVSQNESLSCLKCYVLVKNFDRKSAILLKTLKKGFFNTLL